ncbi:MAG: hypothetical protein WB502_14530, partial [Thermoactinomyces sp.]
IPAKTISIFSSAVHFLRPIKKTPFLLPIILSLLSGSVWGHYKKATVVVKTNSVIIINDTLVDEWEENKSNTSCAVNFVNSILGKEKIACPAEETILSIGVIEKAYELMA